MVHPPGRAALHRPLRRPHRHLDPQPAAARPRLLLGGLNALDWRVVGRAKPRRSGGGGHRPPRHVGGRRIGSGHRPMLALPVAIGTPGAGRVRASARRCRRSCSGSGATRSRRCSRESPCSLRHLPGHQLRRSCRCSGGRSSQRSSQIVLARSTRSCGRCRCCCCSPRSCSSTPRCGRSPGRSTGWPYWRRLAIFFLLGVRVRALARAGADDAPWARSTSGPRCASSSADTPAEASCELPVTGEPVQPIADPP